MTQTTLNIPLARKVLEYAEEEHDDFVFNMQTWYMPSFKELANRGLSTEGLAKTYPEMIKQMKCGTTACLAGTAVILSPEAAVSWTTEVTASGLQYIEDHVTLNGEPTTYFEAARDLMGLTHEQARLLFYTGSNETALRQLRSLIYMAEREEAQQT